MTTFALQARNQRPSRLDKDSTGAQVVSYMVIFMLLFFSMAGFLPIPGGSDTESGTIVGQLYQAVVWLVALGMMYGCSREILRLCWKMKAITFLALLAPASALWSQIPADSLRRGTFLVLSTLFAFYLVRRFTPVQLAQVIVMAGVAAVVLGILTSIVFPQLGVDSTGSWQGPFRSKNACGQITLYFLTAAIPISFPTRGMNMLRALLFPLAAILILMSNAKTSWLLAVAFLMLMGVSSWLRRVKRRDATLIVLGMMFGLVCLAALIPYVLPWALDLLGKDADLTGRIPLWGAAMLSILKRPLLGYGYSAFWTGMQGESLNVFMGAHFVIFQAQNGILEIWLELGFAGVALVLATLVSAFRNALVCFQHEHSEVVSWYVGLIALSIAYNFDEAFFAVSHSIGWLFYMIACAGLATEAARVRATIRLRAVQPVHTALPRPRTAIPELVYTHSAAALSVAERNSHATRLSHA